MTNTNSTQTVSTFADVKVGDIVLFSGSKYQIRSVTPGDGYVDIAFHNTNEGGSYRYDLSEEVDIIS